MHWITHTKPESLGQAGRWQSPYHDTMIDHDKNLGRMLDQLGIADHLRDVFIRQRPAHEHLAGCRDDPAPQREEHQPGRRIPSAEAGARAWKIAPGSVSNCIVQHHDWLPTFLAIAGDTGVVDKLKKGATVNGKKFKNHIDGYNLLPYLTGDEKESPRQGFFYFSDDGDVLSLRFDHWKIVFMEQRCQGTLQVRAEPFTRLRLPKVYNLRMDPYERADTTSNTYYDWLLHNGYFCFAAQAMVAKFMETFKEFPRAQKPCSFTIDDAMEKLSEVGGSS
jgi:arylsulfatase A-like enzyme